MRNFFILILAVSFFIPINSCKKGDEDPFLSLVSREKRIKGDWTIKSFTVNGEDQLNIKDTYSGYSSLCESYYTHISTDKVNLMIFSFSDNFKWTTIGHYSDSYDYDYSAYCSDDYYEDDYNDISTGTWYFENDKEKIRILIPDDDINISFDIIGLSSKDLHLRGLADFVGDDAMDILEIKAEK